MMSKFERLSKPELEFLIDNCNFSEEEIKLIRMANIGKNEIQIADKLNISTSSVTKKKKRILEKIESLLEVLDVATTIYIDGKRVTKDELKNYELKIENIKGIIRCKLTKRK